MSLVNVTRNKMEVVTRNYQYTKLYDIPDRCKRISKFSFVEMLFLSVMDMSGHEADTEQNKPVRHTVCISKKLRCLVGHAQSNL